MENDILVSISCATYNHESYIRQCLEGFVMQKTNFRFEILIHDDASTDGTATIIREYVDKYPNLIKPIFQTENQYSKGVPISLTYNWPRAKGKYIALCEGDDYWTDPYKLQKQVDFLETNKSCVLVVHAHINEFSIDNKRAVHRYSKDLLDCPIQDIIYGGGGWMATNSMIFKSEVLVNYPKWAYEAPIGDYPLMLVLAHKGKVGYMNEVMSCYRVNAVNSWTSKRSLKLEDLLKYNRKIVRLLNSFNKWSNKKYSKFIIKQRLRLKFNLLTFWVVRQLKMFLGRC